MVQTREISGGSSSPLGPSVQKDGVNFSIFSAHATRVTLCLFSTDGKTEIDQIDLTHRTADVWHGFVRGLKEGQLYGYRVDGPYAPREGHRFNANKLLIDPYAKKLFGDFLQDDALYGYDVNSPDRDLSFSTRDSAPYVPKSVVGMPEFNWGQTSKPHTKWSDTIVYEAHVKGFSQRLEGVPKTQRGTLTGLSHPKSIAHLKDQGITAIELLPIQSFFSEPRLTVMGLSNYWGYNPINYFAPHSAYLGPQGEVAFQSAVKALHDANIEVILDVVYNHTAESWELGPTLSYRGIDNASYYHLADNPRYYVNHTGCGNTLDMTHPQVLDLTLKSLRYWVETMHVDGFRFDLAPTLGRNPHDFDHRAEFFQALSSDPVLARTKLIAEPWDIGPNGYVLGQFPKEWAEWNDKFRDDVRSFWRGDNNIHQSLAGRLLGSADIFEKHGRKTSRSVNFVSAHDGFTLRDTVSFNEKHNSANGEDNLDGHSHNLSDNMGVEGSTSNAEIKARRQQRKKNMLATLILSQGTPMLLAGDEFGHSQNGNNNAYCQDNETTWLNWDERDVELEDFTKNLVQLRKTYPHFRQPNFLHGETIEGTFARNVEWLSPTGKTLQNHEWETPNLTCFGIALSLPDEDTLIVILNRGDACDFHLPNSDTSCLLSTSNKTIEKGRIAANSVCVLKNKGHYLPPERCKLALEKLAQDAGIIDSYRDISGHIHHTSSETYENLLEALGVFLNRPETYLKMQNSAESNLQVYGAKHLRETGRCWGVTAALYGLQSKRNWGVGDFEDLATLAELMATKGADFIGINPVHALFPTAPNLYAPYSPSSRHFLNVMYIAPDKIPELPITYSPNLDIDGRPEHIDYGYVYEAKMKAFERAFEVFSTLKKTSLRCKTFQKFVKEKGEKLRNHALFDALFETLPKNERTYDGWRNFPKHYTDPTFKASQEFARNNHNRIQFYIYLQWIAHEQLAAAQQRAKAAGMSIGIYLDFAVGIVPGGSDVWQNKASYAGNVTLGAPGDMANPDGQIWNLSPYNPHILIQNNFEPYRSELRHAMSLGGAVRIDHILGHLRSFWISEHGGTGAYVHYPFDGLINMIAEESQNTGCVIFGEDLGTVPDGFREKVAAHDLMGCNIALIERSHDGHLLPKEHMRELSITGFSNHDFPTLTGFWNGEDFKWREELGIGADAETLRWEKQRRDDDKEKLLNLVGVKQDEAAHMTPQLMAQLQAYLARSKALTFAVQLDDLMLEALQANVPGTTMEQPNWKRRSKLRLEEIATDKHIDDICRAIDAARKEA